MRDGGWSIRSRLEKHWSTSDGAYSLPSAHTLTSTWQARLVCNSYLEASCDYTLRPVFLDLTWTTPYAYSSSLTGLSSLALLQ